MAELVIRCPKHKRDIYLRSNMALKGEFPLICTFNDCGQEFRYVVVGEDTILWEDGEPDKWWINYTGKELSAYGKEIMKISGWVELWDLNYKSKLPSGARGIPDHGFIRDGLMVMVEVKGDGDEIRDDQQNFINDLTLHSCGHVRVVIAQSKEDWDKIADYRISKEM